MGTEFLSLGSIFAAQEREEHHKTNDPKEGGLAKFLIPRVHRNMEVAIWATGSPRAEAWGPSRMAMGTRTSSWLAATAMRQTKVHQAAPTKMCGAAV